MTTHLQRLVSLWDVIHLNLSMLLNSAIFLAESRERMLMCMRHNIGLTSSSESDESVRTSIKNIATAAANLGMPVTNHLAGQALGSFDAQIAARPLPIDSPVILMSVRMMAELLASVHREAADKLVYTLGEREGELYLQKQPLFGAAVSLKLPKAASDIAEAGRCLALDRPTASVFHLMRVAEYAVQRLGKRLRVQINVETETWYQIIIHVNKAVDALPSRTAAQQRAKQRYGAIAAHLNAVRIATRNDVMHPKASYSMEEAQEVFGATRSLMQQVAEII